MIAELWNKIIQTSKSQKQNDTKFDGLHFWNSLKPSLEELNSGLNDKKITWNYQSHDVLRMNFNNKINEISVDTDEKGNIIEWKHFLKQMLWIPHKDEGKFSYHRLMQIALNYGQLLADIDLVPEDIKTIIEREHMFLSDISKYVSQKDLIAIELTETIVQNLISKIDNYNIIEITETENASSEIVSTDVSTNVSTNVSNNVQTTEVNPLTGGDNTEINLSESSDVLSSESEPEQNITSSEINKESTESQNDFFLQGGYTRYYVTYQ
jgi:hypothetical protein